MRARFLCFSMMMASAFAFQGHVALMGNHVRLPNYSLRTASSLGSASSASFGASCFARGPRSTRHPGGHPGSGLFARGKHLGLLMQTAPDTDTEDTLTYDTAVRYVDEV